MSDLNVYQRINAVMRDCEYIQKKDAQQGKGVRYDEVVAMLRPHLINHGLVMVVRQNSMDSLSGVEGTKQKIYQGYYELDIVNIDKPDERVTHTCYAQGMDGGDKGPGKAHTYAMKTLLVKGFGIETGEDEESRAEKLAVVSPEQASNLKTMLLDTGSDKEKFCAYFSVSSIDEIPAKSYTRAVAMIERKK